MNVIAIVAVSGHAYEMVLEDGTMMSVSRNYKPVAGSLPPPQAFTITGSDCEEITWVSERQKILAKKNIEIDNSASLAAYWENYYNKTGSLYAKEKCREYSSVVLKKSIKLSFG